MTNTLVSYHYKKLPHKQDMNETTSMEAIYRTGKLSPQDLSLRFGYMPATHILVVVSPQVMVHV